MTITPASSASRDSAKNAPSASVLTAVVALAVVCLEILVPEIWLVASMIVDHSRVRTPLSGFIAASSIFLFYVPIAFGVLGFCTAAGLLFLKEWARKAAIQLPIYTVVIYALLVIFRPACIVSKPRPNWQLGIMTVGSGLLEDLSNKRAHSGLAIRSNRMVSIQLLARTVLWPLVVVTKRRVPDLRSLGSCHEYPTRDYSPSFSKNRQIDSMPR